MTDTALFTYTLRLADTALVLGHRLSEWIGHAPVLEEELALGNMGLDLIGQARSLYGYAGQVEGRGRDEDALAYLRDAGDYHHLLMVELPNGDFGFTMVRQLFFAAFADPFYRALVRSADAALAAIAAKAEKEMAYHLRHASEWVIRLGDGTEESHHRAQAAVDELWSFTGEMFEADEVEVTLVASRLAPDPVTLKPTWDRSVTTVLAEARLTIPANGWMQSGGRSGRHTEHFGHLLAEMQFLQRAYPGAAW